MMAIGNLISLIVFNWNEQHVSLTEYDIYIMLWI